VSEFEEDLRSALRRQDPPAGFTGRVLARTSPPARTRWIGAAIAACLLLTAGSLGYRQYEGRKAKRELLLALGIAESKLSIVQQKVIDLNRRNTHD
jgi:hypothetical protein